jgi:hypothetical protein
LIITRDSDVNISNLNKLLKQKFEMKGMKAFLAIRALGVVIEGTLDYSPTLFSESLDSTIFMKISR